MTSPTSLRQGALAGAPIGIAVLFAGFTVAVAVGGGAIRSERAARQADLERVTELVALQLETEMDATARHLRATRAYLSTSTEVTPEDLSRFMANVDPLTDPPWRAIAIVVLSPPGARVDWRRFLTRYRDEYDRLGYGEFSLFPTETDSAAGLPILLVEPEEERAGAWGYDMASAEIGYGLFERARASGEIEITPPVRIAGDTTTAAGSLVLLGTFDASVLDPGFTWGGVAVGFTPAELLRRAGLSVDAESARYHAHVLDAAGDTLIHVQSGAYIRSGLTPPDFRTVSPVRFEVPIARHRMVVEWQPSEDEAVIPFTHGLPGSAAVLLVTGLTFVLLWRIGSEQARLSRRLARQERELRSSEEVVAQSQRREALGRLTGGVAHDFNNLLSVIIGSLELMKSHTEVDEEVEHLRANALAASERGARLTQRLLTLGRQATLQPEVFDVNEMIEGSRVILSATVPEKISLVIQPSGDECHVRADRTQFEAALLNLVINARDAMEGGGILTVSRYRTRLPIDGDQCRDLRPGEYVVLSVRDTGTGMRPEVLRAATDPFFTTKADRGGSGLGLSTVLGFAHQSGGDLVIESIEGRGTWARLFLPWVPEPGGADIVPPGEEGPEDGEIEILVVEDEESVRRVLERQLTRLGYEVRTAESGDRAIELLHEGELPDLVLSDVVMPGENDGGAVARFARELDVPVILMSGYPRGLDESDVPDDVRLIAKPFRGEELARAIREELARASDPIHPPA
ncbi:MAG: CHASE domain-containing protein [Longimicrobiales bacterium]|nr:CHASE domain-containing protein [Longimicrobiales bacterium]